MNSFKIVLILASALQVSFSWATRCDINYDNLGIPHVMIEKAEDQFYCLGFLHGQDRGWEMDYLRRIAQGRNAEVLGYTYLKSDLMMRLLDLPRKASELWGRFPNESRKKVELYAEGVNEGLKTGKKAQEFRDLGYLPDEWSALDTLSILLTQSFDQTRKTFFKDYAEEKSREDWGERAPELFDHDGMPWENTILKEGEYPKRLQKKKTGAVEIKNGAPKLWASFPEVFGEESGSNSWVVSAQKSKTGKALLANDPHLDLKTPLFWYWVHLKSPDAEVIGASLPGGPVIAAGTNGKVAWGLTNSYINTADAVFLKNPPEDLFESFRPLVWVKFGPFKLPFFFKSFERLKSGQPVLPLELKNDKKIVLRWSGFSIEPSDMTSMFELTSVKNVTEIDALLKRVGVPSWNFVFADTEGNIGYRMVGRSYKHLSKLPFGIPAMTLDEFVKEEFLDPEERPHILRPARQYVYTANNRHWPGDALYYGGRGYTPSFRGQRLDELLDGEQDIESFKTIQCDRYASDAKYFVPLILKHVQSEELLKRDLRAHDSSSTTSLYRRLMDIMMDEWKVDEYALYRLLSTLDEKQREEIGSFYKRALKDVRGRGWEEFHRLDFKHLSKNENWVFSPEVSGIGDNHTVNVGTARWNSDRMIYEQYSGASMRMIIEMTDRPRVFLALPGLNRDYASKSEHTPWQNWRSCQYTEISF